MGKLRSQECSWVAGSGTHGRKTPVQNYQCQPTPRREREEPNYGGQGLLDHTLHSLVTHADFRVPVTFLQSLAIEEYPSFSLCCRTGY